MIRAATVDDAVGIAAVHVRSWQAAYRGLFPDEILDDLSIERRAASWTQWLTDPAQATAVWVTSEGIVGFVSIGPSRDADASPLTGELTSIYLLPSVWRCGIGTKLMGWATATAAARARTALTLWVLERNAAARAFYERCGFAPDGATKRERFGAAVVDEVRYAWRGGATSA